MTQLKTLKDLDKTNWGNDIHNAIFVSDLKAEAMEHYFYAMKSGEIKLGNWIKHFFNLTEEDVK